MSTVTPVATINDRLIKNGTKELREAYEHARAITDVTERSIRMFGVANLAKEWHDTLRNRVFEMDPDGDDTVYLALAVAAFAAIQACATLAGFCCADPAKIKDDEFPHLCNPDAYPLGLEVVAAMLDCEGERHDQRHQPTQGHRPADLPRGRRAHHRPSSRDAR